MDIFFPLESQVSDCYEVEIKIWKFLVQEASSR